MAIGTVATSPFLLLTLSICLALPVLAVSSHILSVYRDEHASNPWWLPIWHTHFDTHGLIATTVTSCVIFALDLVSVGFVIAGNNKTGDKSKRIKCIKCIIVAFMSVMTIAALTAIIVPAVANSAIPSKSDTVQTWTCRWKNAVGAPENFEALCHESSIQNAVAATRPEQMFDEELVVITKSVDVFATTGSDASPRIDNGPGMDGNKVRV